MQLRFGDRNLASAADDLGLVTRGIARTHRHHRYQLYLAYYDVAMLELDQPLQVNAFIRPVCLPPGPDFDVDGRENSLVTLTGNKSLSMGNAHQLKIPADSLL